VRFLSYLTSLDTVLLSMMMPMFLLVSVFRREWARTAACRASLSLLADVNQASWQLDGDEANFERLAIVGDTWLKIVVAIGDT
jgi:hypothetical protein